MTGEEAWRRRAARRGLDPKWENHRMPCPEPGCDGDLMLRYSPKFDRYFYGCTMWSETGCNGGIGCHKDGRPLGIPADSKTKKHRMAAHDAFDRLWKGSRASMRRGDAYRWLAERMGREIHMAELSTEDCERVVALMHEHYPDLFP